MALGFPLHLQICPPNCCGESNSFPQYLHLYIAGAEGFEPSVSRLTVWRCIPLKLHPNVVREFFILFVVVYPETTPQLLRRYLKSLSHEESNLDSQSQILMHWPLYYGTIHRGLYGNRTHLHGFADQDLNHSEHQPKFCWPGWIRTTDSHIISVVLYYH